MNSITDVAVPGYEVPEVLLLLALAAAIAGARMLMTINTNHWGRNRLLYLLSGGNQAVGSVIAPMPGLASISVALWAAGRALGFF